MHVWTKQRGGVRRIAREERSIRLWFIFTRVSVFATIVSAPETFAAEWNVSKEVAVGGYFSSNICRTPADEEEKLVGTFRPAIALAAAGSRVRTRLRAAAEYNTLADSDLVCPEDSQGINLGNRESWVPSLRFGTDFEAIENTLVLNVSALATQNARNPFLPGGDDNANGLGNTNITYQYGAGATVDRSISRTWNLFARYSYNEQFNPSNSFFGDSQQENIEFDLGMDPFASKIGGGVRGEYSEVDFEETSIREAFTNRLSRASAYVNFRLSNELVFQGGYGIEDNVFISNSAGDLDDDFWDFGFRWTPNNRISVDLGYGERFFGETPRLSVNYRHKKSTLTAGYLRDVQFPRDIRVSGGDNTGIDPGQAGNSDDFGELIPGVPLTGEGGATFIGNSPVLNEAFSLSYALEGRRSRLLLSARSSRQTQLSSGFEGRFESFAASLFRQLSSNLMGSVIATWGSGQRELTLGDELDGSGFDDWRLDFGLSKPLGRYTTASIRYSYYDLKRQTFSGSVGEHRLSFNLSYRI